MTPGMRVHPNKYGFLRLPPGGYGQDLKGHWWVRPPAGDAYQLRNEEVVEHPDGSITTTIKINGHGYMLERGAWRQS